MSDVKDIISNFCITAIVIVAFYFMRSCDNQANLHRQEMKKIEKGCP